MNNNLSAIWGLWIIFSFIFSYKLIVRPIFKYSFKMPFIFHLFFIVTLCFFPYFILWGMWQKKDKKIILENLHNNPCDETVADHIACIHRIHINNHPTDWQHHREIWYFVNGCSTVSTEMKHKLLNKYMDRGLHLNNTHVIDNYKG